MCAGTAIDGTIRVLIADDHPAIRHGLRAAIVNEPDMAVIGEAVDGLQAEDQALKLKPDVMILDIYMPGRDGLQSMLSIKQKLPGVKVLIMTVSDLEEDLLRAVRFGADGYLLKRSSLSEVVSAVRNIVSGKAVLSPHMTTRLMKELREGRDRPELTAREREVLELVAEGLTNAEIAARLVVSASTINTHIYRLLRKLHLKNRAEAIAYLLRHPARSEPY